MKPIITLKSYFGMQAGQTLTQFSAECKALEAQCGSREAFLDFCELCATALGTKLIRE